MIFEHTPVLLKEVIEFLAPKSGGRYFDGTLGGGGYASAILTAVGDSGELVGVDLDDDAIVAAKQRLEKFGSKAIIENSSYAEVAKFGKFDGMVLDLGVSSFQFDEGSRGFSFMKDGPLDMRMDKNARTTAEEVVNKFSEKSLEDIFKNYGEERFAGRIARRIVETRRKNRITTTKQLEEICFVSYPPPLRKGRIHPATRVFQALRIKVNGELENLENFLKSAPKVLNENGRIVIVSYHSLEDRLVKINFKKLADEGGFELLTKKPVSPSEEEIERNARARSAKLRGICRSYHQTH